MLLFFLFLNVYRMGRLVINEEESNFRLGLAVISNVHSNDIFFSEFVNKGADLFYLL